MGSFSYRAGMPSLPTGSPLIIEVQGFLTRLDQSFTLLYIFIGFVGSDRLASPFFFFNVCFFSGTPSAWLYCPAISDFYLFLGAEFESFPPLTQPIFLIFVDFLSG